MTPVLKSLIFLAIFLSLYMPKDATAACRGTNQGELTACAVKKLENAEAAMNRLYRSMNHTPALIASQNAWVAYRNADCRYAHHATPRGSMYGMEEAYCRAQHTKDRIKLLQIYKRENFSTPEVAVPRGDTRGQIGTGEENKRGFLQEVFGWAEPVTVAGQQLDRQRAAILVQKKNGVPNEYDILTGDVIWSSKESRRPNANGSRAVFGNIDINSIGTTIEFSIEENKDLTLAASHVITVRFNRISLTLPQIHEVGHIQMRDENSPSNDPLTGAGIKVADDVFLFALSSNARSVKQNMEALNKRAWFDIPIKLSDGRLAKITFQKGNIGQQLIDNVLKGWYILPERPAVSARRPSSASSIQDAPLPPMRSP